MRTEINPASPVMTLHQALIERQMIDHMHSYDPSYSDIDVFVENVAKNKEIASIPIKRYVGRGVCAIVFETADGDILKLTEGSHFPLGRPHECFDVPIFRKGKAGKVTYYFEEKLMQHDLNKYFVLKVKEMIAKCGYKASDLGEYDIHQIGISDDGKLYLIDPECAKFKTVFHALWCKIKSLKNYLKIK
ncbi:hypothetical protein IJ579_03825 [bacterium]|nr:hypothetical protein [bacterium]